MKKEGLISEEEYNQEPEAADDEISKGNFIDRDELKKDMLKW